MHSNSSQIRLQTQSSLAFQYYNARDYEKAAPLMLEVYKLTRNSTYFKYYLDCLIQLEKYDEAVSKIQTELKKQNPERPEFYVHWGRVLKVQKSWMRVSQKYELALEIVTGDRNQYAIIGQCFSRMAGI